MKKVLFFVVTFICLNTAQSSGTEISFLNFCNYLEVDEASLTKDEKAITISCIAFISGITQTHASLVAKKKIKPLYCKPAVVSNGDIGRLYARHMRSHKAEEGVADSDRLIKLLKETYPCKR